MADRAPPVVPSGSAPAPGRSRGKIALWIAIAAVVAMVAVVVFWVVGFGGDSGQQAAPPRATTPAEIAVATTVPAAPVTTTTQPIVAVFDQDPPTTEALSAETPEPPDAEPSTGPDGDDPAEDDLSPPAAVRALAIRDAGDFTGSATLPCVDFAVRFTWQVLPPYEVGEDENDRVRTDAPVGSQGRVRVVVDTHAPAEHDAADAPPDAETDGGQAPDAEAAGEDSPSDAPPEDEMTLLPVSALVLEASDIGGRGTDRESAGDLIGVVRHRCPATSLAEFHDLTLTVEGHAEIAWEIVLASVDAQSPASPFGQMDGWEVDFEPGNAENDEAFADGIGLGHVVELITDEEGAGSADQ